MNTDLRKMLGCEFPIMAFTHCRDVVAAVCKAGGFGVLGATAHTPEHLDMELKWIENEIGDLPYGIDVLIPHKFLGKEKGGLERDKIESMIPEEHKNFLEALLQEFGVPPREKVHQSSVGMELRDERLHDLVDVAFRHNSRLVANALGPPPQWMIDKAKDQGRLVAALAGKAEHARRHVEMGVDMVVAQGYEAGGHTGEIATMILIPEVVAAVGEHVPVVAAGGIASGQQVTAALALGAQGVWTGSVWLTTEEAETDPVVKKKFLNATSSDTIRSRSRTGKPARQLRSAWTDAWEDPSNPDPLPMPLQPYLISEAINRINAVAHKSKGAEQLANYFVGQVVGSMNHVRPARAVVEEMIQEYADTMERLNQWAEG